MLPAEVPAGKMACFNCTYYVRCGHCDSVAEARPCLSEAASFFHCFTCRSIGFVRTTPKVTGNKFCFSQPLRMPMRPQAPSRNGATRKRSFVLAFCPTPPIQGVARAPTTPPVQGGVPVFNQQWAGSASAAVFNDLPVPLPGSTQPQEPALPPGVTRAPSPYRSSSSRRPSRGAQSASSNASWGDDAGSAHHHQQDPRQPPPPQVWKIIPHAPSPV